jgi:hypothetical protein
LLYLLDNIILQLLHFSPWGQHFVLVLQHTKHVKSAFASSVPLVLEREQVKAASHHIARTDGVWFW